MTIQLTETARRRMQSFLQHDTHARGVRFGVRRTGCSGFGYVVELAEDVADGDHVVEVEGVPLIIDARSLPLVDGTTIDFRREGLNTTFVFDNPHTTGECGCGESVALDPARD